MNRGRSRLAHTAVALALSLLLIGSGSGSASGASSPAAENRLVAIGDIHGAHDQVVSILRETRLIDTENQWIGGAATLVQTGDFLDRGSRVREVMDLLMSLQEQAGRQGGRALVLLGNHELLNLKGDFVDVAPEAFAAFADRRSEKRRQRASKEYVRWSERHADLLEAAKVSVESAADWLLRHPPGLLEYQEAIGPVGRYGRWLRSLPTVARVGDSLFVHGGLALEFAASDEESINRQVSEELEELDDCRARLITERLILPTSSAVEMANIGVARLQQIRDELESDTSRTTALEQDLRRQHEQIYECVANYNERLINDNDGPHHFRGHALAAHNEGLSDLSRVLTGWSAKRIVVGHSTLANGRITDRFDAQVFLIDTGMLSSVYSGGRASALEMSGDQIRAIYLDGSGVLKHWPTPAPQPPSLSREPIGRAGRDDLDGIGQTRLQGAGGVGSGTGGESQMANLGFYELDLSLTRGAMERAREDLRELAPDG